jgi:hypothetical protein
MHVGGPVAKETPIRFGLPGKPTRPRERGCKADTSDLADVIQIVRHCVCFPDPARASSPGQDKKLSRTSSPGQGKIDRLCVSLVLIPYILSIFQLLALDGLDCKW